MRDWSQPKQSKAQQDWSRPKQTEEVRDWSQPRKNTLSPEAHISTQLEQRNIPQNSFMRGVDIFNEIMGEYAAPVAGGILQGVGDVGASVGNLALNPAGRLIGKDISIPHPSLKRHLKPGMATDIGFAIGDILGQGIPAVKGLGLLNKIGKRPGGYKGLLTDLLKGGALGFSMGEEGPGGRLGSALIGGILNPAGSLRASKISERVIEGKRGAQSQYKNLYNDFFKEVEEKGLGSLNKKTPNIDIKAISEGAGNKFKKALIKFEEMPNVKNAHKAQSDIGKAISDLKNKSSKSGLLASESNALEEAISAQKKLKGYIFNSLKSDPKLVKKYSDITKGYGKDVIPYTRNKALADFERGELKAQKLPKKLSKNDKFMMAKGKEYPEVTLRNALNTAIKSAALGGGALGAYKIYENL